MNFRPLLWIGLGLTVLAVAWPRKARAALTGAPLSPSRATAQILVAYPQAGEPLASKIVEVAQRLGAHPFDLANQIAFESGFTFSPTQENYGCRRRHGPDSGRCAVGLIQFLPSTAAGLFGMRKVGGSYTASQKLEAYQRMASLSAIEQMYYVERYYAAPWLKQKAGGIYDTPHKLALATFYPAYLNKPVDTLFPASVTAANPNIYTPRDYVAAKLRLAKLPPSFQLAEREGVLV